MLKRHIVATVITAIFLELILPPTAALVTRLISGGSCLLILSQDPAQQALDELYFTVRADRVKHALSVMLALLALATRAGLQALQRRGAMHLWIVALVGAVLALLSTLALLECRLRVLLAGPVWVVALAVFVVWALSILVYQAGFSFSERL